MRVTTGLVSARGGVLLALAAALLALSTVGMESAKAKKKAENGQIVFASDRTTVENPEGDREIFIMNPDGTKRKQLTKNAASDFDPVLSPDGQKVAYTSVGVQTSNPEGDTEVYLVNADGSKQKNLSDNGAGVADFGPGFSPNSQKVAYQSQGAQTSNSEGDNEVFVGNANNLNQMNLTDNTASDSSPNWAGEAK